MEAAFYANIIHVFRGKQSNTKVFPDMPRIDPVPRSLTLTPKPDIDLHINRDL